MIGAKLTSKCMKSVLRRRLSENANFQATHQQFSGRKRFYKEVKVDTIVGTEATTSESYRILLDGRELKTPARNALHLPNRDIAMMIAAEWDAQTDKKRGIQPATMPFTTLAATALDQISTEEGRTRATATVLGYLPTDTMLYFTEEQDRILLKKQHKHYNPILSWFRDAGVELCDSRGGMVLRMQHPEEATARITALVSGLDHYELTFLQAATLECKSVLMAIALLCGKLPFAKARLVSRLEEEFQIEIWGAVEGGHDMDRLNNAVSLGSVVAFHRLYSATSGRTLDI